MSVLDGTRRKFGLAGLMVTMFAAAAIPGQAVTDEDRCDAFSRGEEAADAAPGVAKDNLIDLDTQPNAQGTNGDDIIFGSDDPDVINGLGGNDVICGFGGGDTIDGGPGADTVYGGDGDDRIHGNDGDDVLYGDAGSDQLDGDAGNDQLFAGDD